MRREPREGPLATILEPYPRPSFRTERADFFFPLRSCEAVGPRREKEISLIVNVDPGLRQFCSQAENKAKTSVNVEPGKIYFIQQHVRIGFMKAENTLEDLDESKGREALAKSHPSPFAPK